MDTLASLCKRRGFIFPSSEIYGGFESTWDYGPLGVELKQNVKRAWWKAMVQERDDIVGLDASILMNPRVWEASGHTTHFTDTLVECQRCHHRFRADELKSAPGGCPECEGPLTEARQFNTMFKTFVGPVEDEASVAYLRPETAQGIFVNFENVLTATRRKLPFGIAQQGKEFRNEITTGNFIFRTREFEAMEMEFFCKPGTDDEWYQYWRQERLNWYLRFGVRKENIRLREYAPEERAHYSSGTTDVEYLYPMGWAELEGIANRTDYDLRRHAEMSGRRLEFFDEETGEHIVPYVVEPAAGVDRCVLIFLLDAYHEEEVRGEKRVILRLHPYLAPIKVAVLPLSRNEQLVPAARRVWDLLRPRFMTQYDDAQSIGRRYRRQDEVGTPLCVTVDFDTLEDQAVTIRERDSMEQVRVPIANLEQALRERLPEV
ncbi:MAG: glycine--tRNA ligase [Chloroflexi bacterium RBG_16_68_14]|nr:MAG: glycine--tRNA ligase [Chloroflexi bacterium RBG_16_68_14]